MKAIVGIVCACSLACSAQAAESEYLDWFWDTADKTKFYAVTVNAAGYLFGQYCTLATGNCFYTVTFGTKCNKGDKYPALINTDSGAASIELICGDKLDNGGNAMFAADFDQVDSLIKDSSRIGFVLPMEGDEFKAVRFSLRGSKEALTTMREKAAEVTGGLKAVQSL